MDRQREQWKREMARLERLHKRLGEWHPACREDQRQVSDVDRDNFLESIAEQLDNMNAAGRYVYVPLASVDTWSLYRIERASGHIWSLELTERIMQGRYTMHWIPVIVDE